MLQKVEIPKDFIKKQEQEKYQTLLEFQVPYEEPMSPDITINTEKNNLKKCVKILLDYLDL